MFFGKNTFALMPRLVLFALVMFYITVNACSEKSANLPKYEDDTFVVKLLSKVLVKRNQIPGKGVTDSGRETDIKMDVITLSLSIKNKSTDVQKLDISKARLLQHLFTTNVYTLAWI